MTTAEYLYSAAVIILCTALISGYIVCFSLRRERGALYLALLFFLYLAGEFIQIFTFFDSPAQLNIPFSPSPVWILLCLVPYFLLPFFQIGRQPGKGDWLFFFLACLPVLFPSVDILPLPLVLSYGVRVLFPYRRSNRRTQRMLWAACLMDTAFLLLALSAFLPFLHGYIAQIILCDLPLYIALSFSCVDLIQTLRSFRPGATSQNSPEKAAEPSLASIAQEIARQYRLSPRESQVFLLLSQGSSVQNIADSLFISTGTVKLHIHNCYQKLGVSKRSQINQLLMDKLHSPPRKG